MAVTFDTTDSCECNNRIEDACVKPINTSFEAKILGVNNLVSDGSNVSGVDLDGDQDWYRVQVPCCGILSVKLTSVAINQRLRIEFWNASNSQFEEVLGQPSQSVSLAELVVGGTYYIRITDNLDQEFDDPYTVSISFDASPIVTQVDTTYSTSPTSGNIYQWFRDGVLISGANSNVYTSSIPGDYTVCISNSSTCSTCSSLSATSFENDTELPVYPNPTNSKINIQLPNGSIIDNIMISDITGKKVLEQNQNTTLINVENLAKGLYIIEAYSSNKKFQSKFIKE